MSSLLTQCLPILLLTPTQANTSPELPMANACCTVWLSALVYLQNLKRQQKMRRQTLQQDLLGWEMVSDWKRCRLDIRKKVFTLRKARCQHRLPREVVDVPFLFQLK